MVESRGGAVRVLRAKAGVAIGFGCRFLSAAMAVVIAVGLMPLPAFAADGDDEASGLAAGLAVGGLSAQRASVRNPRVVSDSSMRSGQRVTWDCVWFGTYPQSEVTASDAAYSSLEGASWDANGDATVGGARYRRISKDDATSSANWPGESAAYRYFKYEPVKWRVLKASGGEALVLADVALDCRRYNKKNTSVTWETSSIASARG